jgi:L-galactose dehydrogenase/L-glyceraldehyde 3-phosphate reductase
MTRGDAADQERAVARALDAGINYFDTAPQYGNGESEKNLGRVLKSLKPKNIVIGTKVRLPEDTYRRIGDTIAASLDASLQRLGRDQVDLFQLHNQVAARNDARSLSVDAILNEVVPAFERLRKAGKTRFIGITALGETDALHRVVDARVFDTGQVAYNALSPSAGGPIPARYPGQDYRNLLARMAAANIGAINIRVLAGGALSGAEARHPLGSPVVEPIGSGATYSADAKRALRLQPLLDEGHASSLIEAGLRFVIAHKAISTVLVGYSNMEHLETAIAAMNKGPLPAAALNRLTQVQESFAGEAA